MQFFKNLKVYTKLFSLIFVSLFVTVVIGMFSFIQTNNMSKDMTMIYEERFIPNTWITNAIDSNLSIDSILIQMMMSKDLNEKQQLHNKINDGVDRVLADFASYEAMDLSEEERTEITNFFAAVERLTNNQDEVIRLALVNQNDAAYKLFKDIVQDARADLIISLSNLSTIKEQQTAAISEENVATASNTATTMLIFIAVAIVLLLILGLYITKLIVNPIKEVKEKLAIAQAGDFTARGEYQSQDELGQLTSSFNEMMGTLQLVLQQVKSSAVHVDETAYELSANIEQSTASSDHVVSSIQEIAGGSEQTKLELENNRVILTRVIQEFNNIQTSIHEIEQLSQVAYSDAQDGTSIVANNVQQMKQIQNSIVQSNSVVQALANQVSEVDEILKVINNISEQTNLLALNAAIEAARAGEHGKGFAVVADEVRKLAEQSLASTKSIANILTNIKKDTVQSVDIMNVVMKEAEAGSVTTQTTAQKFEDILNNTNEITPKMKDMSTTLESLTSDFNTFTSNADTILNIAVNNAQSSELASVATEQQSQSMEDMNKSARGLTNVASELNQAVQKFKL